MKTLYIERSTGSYRDGNWVESLDLDGVTRIVVGTGPGSFAGIRSALAFAQGYALGRPCEVMGLPSACALAAQAFAGTPPASAKLAVIGDARQGKLWVALFDGFWLERPIFQINQPELRGTVPSESGAIDSTRWQSIAAEYFVVTPDESRIGEELRAAFGNYYLGGLSPTAEGLQRFAEACPSILVREPLPIYLKPAVR